MYDKLKRKHAQDKHIKFLNKFNKLIRLMHNMKGDYHVKKCMILAHVKDHSTHCWTTYLLPKNSEKHWYLSSKLHNYNTYKAMKNLDLISVKIKNL